MHKLHEFLASSADTPGWFRRHAAAMWDCLLDYQESHGIEGDFVEVGVWKGKSASFAALHCRETERCVFVDHADLTEAKENVDRAAPAAKTTFMRTSSGAFLWDPIYKELAGRTRWFHIDGGHSTADVLQDLEVANGLMAPGGIAVLDDFFSPAYPQITQAAFRYLDQHPEQFALFLLGYNKGFLCRPAALPQYLSYIKDSMHAAMCELGCGDITIWKTTTTEELSAFGVTADLGSPYRGLDEDHGTILI